MVDVLISGMWSEADIFIREGEERVSIQEDIRQRHHRLSRFQANFIECVGQSERVNYLYRIRRSGEFEQHVIERAGVKEALYTTLYIQIS